MWRNQIGKAGWLLFLVLLLLWASSTVVAGPLPQSDVSPVPDDVTPVPPLETDVPIPPEPDELVSAAGALVPLAIPSAQMNYQGYLTDIGGQPLDGTFDMTFRLFDDPAAGTLVWGDEVHAGVVVSHGLFQVVLGETAPLDPSTMFDEQLYLESVVGTTTLPRQMLRAVPYAMGLVGGAQVRANTASVTGYGMTIVNAGGRGLHVDASGNGLYGLANDDITYSSEGYAGPDTEVWIPAGNAVMHSDDSADAHVNHRGYGQADIVADNTVNVTVLLPVQIERPYGRSYQVKSATVYYATDANSTILDTWFLGRNLSTGATVTLAQDATDRTSNVYASYQVDPLNPPVTLATASMMTTVQFLIDMNAVGATVTIYAVRLTLDSSY